MKFVSPFQRGTMCQCKWPGRPAPATRPRFKPDVEALGIEQFASRQTSRVISCHRFALLVGRELVEPSLVRAAPRANGRCCRDTDSARDHPLAAMDDQILPIVGVGDGATKEALRVGAGQQFQPTGCGNCLSIPFDVGQPPGGPELLMFQDTTLPILRLAQPAEHGARPIDSTGGRRHGWQYHCRRPPRMLVSLKPLEYCDKAAHRQWPG